MPTFHTFRMSINQQRRREGGNDIAALRGEAVSSKAGCVSGGHGVVRADAMPHLQDGCSCVVDGQDVGDVVLRQQLPVSCICGSQRKSRNPTCTTCCKLRPKLSLFYPTTTSPAAPHPPPLMCPRHMWLYGFKVLLLF